MGPGEGQGGGRNGDALTQQTAQRLGALLTGTEDQHLLAVAVTLHQRANALVEGLVEEKRIVHTAHGQGMHGERHRAEGLVEVVCAVLAAAQPLSNVCKVGQGGAQGNNAHSICDKRIRKHNGEVWATEMKLKIEECRSYGVGLSVEDVL